MAKKEPIFNILLENALGEIEEADGVCLKNRRYSGDYGIEVIDSILKSDINFTIKEEDLQDNYKKKKEQ